MDGNSQIPAIRRFKAYLALERSLAANTVEAYMRDVRLLFDFFDERHIDYRQARLGDFEDFLAILNDLGLQARSQARIVSGIKAFYKYLIYSNELEADPTELLQTPMLPRYLPEVLSVEEIERILAAIDLSKPEGQRNRAIVETLYGSGLRVSELVNLKLSDIDFEQHFMRVEGKGSKQRLVPLSEPAENAIKLWLYDRNLLTIKHGQENFAFLNRRGHQLTREMIFTIVRRLAAEAGVRKTISPHTFRHSFATHMLEGGANLRAIQAMLGHESILTTEIYTHMDMTFLRTEILDKHPRNKKERTVCAPIINCPFSIIQAQGAPIARGSGCCCP